MRVQRYERIDIESIPKDKIQRTDAGFLRLPVYATRTGVFRYSRPDGSVVREGRIPDEVFDPHSMASMKSIPVTNDHPAAGVVDSRNAASLARGFTGESVEIEKGKYLATNVTVMDENAIQDILNGKVQVSMGYMVERDETPGEIDGEPYDLIQRKIRYNHLAIVSKGRAGPEVRFRLDSEENQLPIFEEDGMKRKIKIDEKEFELEADVADAVEKVLKDRAMSAAEIEKMKKKMKEEEDGKKKDGDPELKTKYDAALKDLDKLQASNDALSEENEKLKKAQDGSALDQAGVRALIKEHARIEKVARRILDDKQVAALDSMDDKAIKLAVIKADSPTFDEKGKSDTYLDARFDHIADRVLASNEDETRELGRKFTKAVSEDNLEPAEKSRRDSWKKTTEAWKQPLSAHT